MDAKFTSRILLVLYPPPPQAPNDLPPKLNIQSPSPHSHPQLFQTSFTLHPNSVSRFNPKHAKTPPSTPHTSLQTFKHSNQILYPPPTLHPQFQTYTPQFQTYTPQFQTYTPPIPNLHPPNSKLTPPNSKLTPPQFQTYTPPIPNFHPPIPNLHPPNSKLTPPQFQTYTPPIPNFHPSKHPPQTPNIHPPKYTQLRRSDVLNFNTL